MVEFWSEEINSNVGTHGKRKLQAVVHLADNVSYLRFKGAPVVLARLDDGEWYLVSVMGSAITHHLDADIDMAKTKARLLAG